MTNHSSSQESKETLLRGDLAAATDVLGDPSSDHESKSAALRAMMGLSVELAEAVEERHVASREHIETVQKKD